MKVLLISYAFPPFNAIGSVRAAQLASFLEGAGHDVRIVAGDGLPYPIGMKMPSLKAKIFRARLRKVEAPIDFARRLLAGQGGPNGASAPQPTGWMSRLVGLYRALVAIPDGQVGWYLSATKAAKQAVRDWVPDVIVSSALPFTAHMVGSRMACRLRKPWVAEFRDLFTGNPYSELPHWRQRIDRQIEKAVLRNVSATVAVTPEIARELQRIHLKPSQVVMNGYDAVDINDSVRPPTAQGRTLQLLYTGIIYPGRRDPTPLFQAISLMGDRGRRVRVSFYGQDLRGVREAADRAGVLDQIEIRDPVPYQESLLLQRQADVLLLLLWDDPRERGTLTGKVFEYIGASRPVLAIGCEDGIASKLVRERHLGTTATCPEAIAAALKRWIDEIDATGTVDAVAKTARSGLSRADQFALYEQLLQSVIR